MNLFINSFTHSDKERQRELEFCLERNEANEFIERIYVINKDSRATFGQFFKILQLHPESINIIANLDIYFDDTIQLAKNIRSSECYALTRWEDYGGNIISFKDRHGKRVPTQWSQDAWIFRGCPVNPKAFDNVVAVNSANRMNEQIPFCLGTPGCDNKLAAMLKQFGVVVTNPSFSIKAIHVHNDESRSYPNYQILRGIRPHGLVYQESL